MARRERGIRRLLTRTGRAIAATAFAAVGCDLGPTVPVEDRSALPSPSGVSVVSADVLSGEALASLGPDGHFAQNALPLPVPYETLTRDEASAVVSAFLGIFAFGVVPQLERDRGAPIDGLALSQCAPAVYAESSFEAAPDSAEVAFRVLWGPHWIVVLCEGEHQVGVMAVSAFATALRGSGVGQWSFDDSEYVNAAVLYRGLPVGVRYPLSAEEAAARIAALTGRRVDSVPRLFSAKPLYTPTWTLWSVHLESSVTVRGVDTGASRVREFLWFGLLPSKRWLMSAVDGTPLADVGPFASSYGVHRPDGSWQSVPIILGRRPVPAFYGAEAISVLQPGSP